MSLEEYMIKRLRMLLKWRHYVKILCEAVRKILPDAEVYVFGSAIQSELTAVSDIDVLIVSRKVPKTFGECSKIRSKIRKEAEKLGIPWDYPLEIHLATPEEAETYKKLAKKMLKIC